MDKAINSGIIRPVIVVIPNEYTLYRGSFYTNSSLAGNWADFTAKDLVSYIDQHYRTIPDRESRGLSGHSMGGYGAIKLGMLFPDVYSCVYALSPAVLGIAKELGPEGIAYKRAGQIKTREELITGYKEFPANVVVTLGRAFSPDPSNPPFYCDLPYTYIGDTLTVNKKVLDLWNQNLPLNMADQYAGNLKKLKALKLDWGRNDENAHIPFTCLLFSKKLENLGVNHYAEEYIGTHGSKIMTDDGRLLNELLPFFNKNLVFEEMKLKAAPKSKSISKRN